MKIKSYHLEILDLLVLDDDALSKKEWINKISQRDLYSIASWLMVNLTAESSGIEHKRSAIRSILAYYYDQMTYYNNTSPWNEKSKWFLGNAVINLWSSRQVENDLRYQYN
jgi:hypothetical protein